MKKLSLIIFFSLLASLSFSQSLLWKISGKGLKEPSYLYGTFHIKDSRVFSYDSTVTNAFVSCSAYAMEILLDEIDPVAVQKSTLMKDNSLDNLLTKEQYYFVDSVFKKKLGISLLLYKKMKPFFLSSLITQTASDNKNENALDLHFLKTARTQNKQCIGLEKFEDQIAVIDKIPYKEQAEMLYNMLKDTVETHEEEFDKMMDIYMNFDLSSLLEMTKNSGLGSDFEENFIILRNKTMAKNLKKIIKKQTVFCAVGAAHLPGDNGVIELLRESGYIVEAVPFKWIDIQ